LAFALSVLVEMHFVLVEAQLFVTRLHIGEEVEVVLLLVVVEVQPLQELQVDDDLQWHVVHERLLPL
jgi:hypothetical protein